jgi:hypothetical protein
MGIILHEALKTGPLSSEAQGLDLSVNIAGGGSSGALHVAGLKLMLDLRTALLREVFLAGPGGVGIDAVASLGTCEAVRVEVGVRANVVFVGGFLAVLWDGHGLFLDKYYALLDTYYANLLKCFHVTGERRSLARYYATLHAL